MRMQSKYVGRCALTGKKIFPGDWVDWTPDRGAVLEEYLSDMDMNLEERRKANYFMSDEHPSKRKGQSEA